MSLSILMDYFTKHKLSFFVLNENKYDVHPSWLKLKCFDYIEDDFVLCWDMDLLPRRFSDSIEKYLNHNLINLVADSGAPISNYPYFKYNCGLMGIPKKYRSLLDRVFLQAKTSTEPAYEQFPLNKELKERNFLDIHELNPSWNCIFSLNGIQKCFNNSTKAIHYTGCSDFERQKYIKTHHTAYFALLSQAISSF